MIQLRVGTKDNSSLSKLNGHSLVFHPESLWSETDIDSERKRIRENKGQSYCDVAAIFATDKKANYRFKNTKGFYSTWR